MTEISVPKGTVVHVGIMGSNMNKQLWGEDAWEWKPERWLAPLPETLSEAHIPGVYSNLSVSLRIFLTVLRSHHSIRMTFIGGGRACMYVSIRCLTRILLLRPCALTSCGTRSGFKFSQLEMSQSASSFVPVLVPGLTQTRNP